MPLKDAAWHERMYNNRALVPDFADHFTQWVEASLKARRQIPGQLDVRYGNGPNEMLDVFPAVRPKAPVVVFIHGGYWRSLDKSQHSFVVPALHRMGVCVVVVNYALCPGSAQQPVTIPDIAMQMTDALAWVWGQIGFYGGDRSNITVIGHSAGGHLASMLLACHWEKVDASLPRKLVRKAMSISGLFDLMPLCGAPFLQQDLRITPVQVQLASPATWPRPKQGVLYTVVGGDESPEFLRHSRLIRQAWGDRVVPVCEELPGMNHFSVLAALTDPAHRLHQLAARLISLA